MTFECWIRVIDEAASLGIPAVRFIGGEPTLHENLGRLVSHALYCGMAVEVFSNLVHITDRLWKLFSRPGVSLATSYYSDLASEHASIARRRTHGRTKSNIIEALRRAIPLRVVIIDIQEGQRSEQARKELETLGVREILVDRIRQVGRGVRNLGPDNSQLCGHCAQDVAAVSSNGNVWPCVFGRWMTGGNVQRTSLGEILYGKEMVHIADTLAKIFTKNLEQGVNCGGGGGCGP
jgi:MoaA/NifB/PqqE/SkfB family radical SAM enzyme